MGFDCGDSEVFYLWLEEGAVCAEVLAYLFVGGVAMEDDFGVVFVGVFECGELGAGADDVDGEVEEECGFDGEVYAFVGFDGADIEEVVGAGWVVVCGWCEVVGSDWWVDDDGIAVVGVSDLVCDEV